LLGEALLQAGRGREAIAALETACRLAPETATLWLDLGDAHRALGERDAALEAYGKVIALRRAQCGAQAPSDSAFVAATQAIETLAPSR
jgi:Flp pilus assembly protein TadD